MASNDQQSTVSIPLTSGFRPAFSQAQVSYRVQPTTTTSKMSIKISFLDIPPEIRLMVYAHITPRWMEIGLYAYRRSNDSYGLHQMDTEDPADRELLQTTSSLLRTHSTIRREVNPLLYASNEFVFSHSLDLEIFGTSLTHASAALVNHATLEYLSGGERDVKNELEAGIRSLYHLQTLKIMWANRAADQTSKGTPWKPFDLRKLAVVQKSSRSLSKTFWCPTPGGKFAVVWFGDAMSQPRQEPGAQTYNRLNVTAEYRKWLAANAQRRAQRKAHRLAAAAAAAAAAALATNNAVAMP